MFKKWDVIEWGILLLFLYWFLQGVVPLFKGC